MPSAAEVFAGWTAGRYDARPTRSSISSAAEHQQQHQQRRGISRSMSSVAEHKQQHQQSGGASAARRRSISSATEHQQQHQQCGGAAVGASAEWRSISSTAEKSISSTAAGSISSTAAGSIGAIPTAPAQSKRKRDHEEHEESAAAGVAAGASRRGLRASGGEEHFPFPEVCSLCVSAGAECAGGRCCEQLLSIFLVKRIIKDAPGFPLIRDCAQR